MRQPAQPIEFYKLPFKKAKAFHQRLYLNLQFIDDLKLDPKTLKLKAFYTRSSLFPVIIVDNQSINRYVMIGPSSSFCLENPDNIAKEPTEKHIFFGYKFFDKWLFETGEQIGDLNTKVESKKLQRMVQRRLLGFWQFWAMRITRKI